MENYYLGFDNMNCLIHTFIFAFFKSVISLKFIVGVVQNYASMFEKLLVVENASLRFFLLFIILIEQKLL